MKRKYNIIQKCLPTVISFVLILMICACSPDEFTGIDDTGAPSPFVPVVNSVNGYENFLFYYDKGDGSFFLTRYLDKGMGDNINVGTYFSDWDYLTGVKAGYRQFIVGHDGSKDFFIRSVNNNGTMGDITDSGKWGSNYETFFGFHVGNRGFIFGQDSYGGNYWFVQEVTGHGRLAGNESDNGHWHHYYQAAIPLYVNDQTYLFFQTDDIGGNNYWFIAHVSQDGVLTDVCDGYWGNFWNKVASVTMNGKTYLFGERTSESIDGAEWFIERINSDGTMGEETDRGTWNNFYEKLIGYESKGHGYILGENSKSHYLFIQEITESGKMSAETYHEPMDVYYKQFIPFYLYDPDGFRYIIGWDMSKTNGSPALGWTSLFQDSWTGETRLGGGAALANIDKDAGQRYDAVFTGIESRYGADRHYYKVAWNLDNSGKAVSMSKTFYGPSCGELQDGGGADIADIDGNGVHDLLVMSVDDPAESNSFWYYIGWNMGTNGQVASWSPKIQVNGLGSDNKGGGAALGDIDQNGKQDLVMMGIDDPKGSNSFWYKIGRNLDKTGNAASWTAMLSAPVDLGDLSAGGGAALADINGNGKPDLVLTDIDSPAGLNQFWCCVGWDIDINGNVTGWSPKYIGPAPGNMTSGGGTAVGDINKNGIPDLLLMSVDDPYGND